MRVIGCLSAAAIVIVSSAAQARDFLYSWKPTATIQQASDDQGACLATAKTAREDVDVAERRLLRGQAAPPPPTATKSWLASGLDGQSAFFNRYYDCLRERGYSIRRMPAAEYGKLKKSPEGGAAVMARMIAPESPHNEVPPGTIK